MTSVASKPVSREIPRVDFGRVSVFLGEKNGKYPDGNQVLVRGADTRAAFDAPIVSNYIGAEFDSTELVIMGHVHEDHMAGLEPEVGHSERVLHAGDVGFEGPRVTPLLARWRAGARRFRSGFPCRSRGRG